MGINKKNDTIIFLTIGLIWGVLNNVSIHSTILSLFVGVSGYGVVFFYILNKKSIEAFKYFMLFTVLSVESDTFVTGDSSISIERWSFLRLPLLEGHLYILCLIVLYFLVREHNRKIKLTNDKCIKLRKWLFLFLITGIISIIIGMSVNDNGIMNWEYYPKLAISQLISFLPLFFIFLTSIEITKSKHDKEIIKKTCELLLIIVAITIFVSVFVFGVTGLYGDHAIMMGPLSIALTPILIAFYFYKDCHFRFYCLLAGLLIFGGSLIYGTAIGSKWYIILLVAVLELIVLATGFKSVVNVVVIGLVSLLLVTSFAEPILNMIGNDYISWKLSQTLNLLSFSGESGGDWYAGLDHSTLYRLDEPNNVLIEYSKKPWFALFGKGFGGTTLHHTNILLWEFDKGAFSFDQVRMGAYYHLHESLAIILLRHGFLGVVFMGITIVNLFKKLSTTPWAMISLVWFVFYWSYGIALTIGAVSLVIIYSEDSAAYNKKTFNKKGEILNSWI